MEGNEAPKQYQVVALGSAIVDIFCQVDDRFVHATGIPKGSMQLVGANFSDDVLEQVGDVEIRGGGSAANTLSGLANLGHSTALVARTDLDELGSQYLADLTRSGIAVYRPEVPHQLGTGRCLVMVTPDGERTMATWLGAASELTVDAKALAAASSAQIVYTEGYLYDLEHTKKEIDLTLRRAYDAGALVCFSLSDPYCARRHREEFLELLAEPVSVVFSNHEEAAILAQSADLDTIISFLRKLGLSGAVTLGKDGALVFDESTQAIIPARSVSKVVDTTGAGDLFAAGYVHGLLTLEPGDISGCGRFGVVCAGEVISHFGARPDTDLRTLLGEVEA